MRNAGNNTLPKTNSNAPEPTGSGPCLPASVRHNLDRCCARFVKSLRGDPVIARSIAVDPVTFRSELARTLRTHLPVKRGRPSDPRLDEAWKLVQQGKKPTEVLREQIPDWSGTDPYTRYLAAKGLRQALLRRRISQKKDRKDPVIDRSKKHRS